MTLERLDWETHRHRPRVFAKGDTILIAYASHSGTAKSIAEELYRDNSTQCDVIDLANATPDMLTQYGRLVFVVATYGDGDPPPDAVSFYESLCNSALDMQEVLFSVLALGDHNFPNFCGFGNKLHKELERNQATPRMPIAEIHRVNAALIAHWRNKLHETFDLAIPVQNTEWQVATLMDKKLDSQQLITEATLYVKSLEQKTAQAIAIQHGQHKSARQPIIAPVVSDAFEPFTRINIEPASLDADHHIMLTSLSQSPSGEKWLVRVIDESNSATNAL